MFFLTIEEQLRFDAAQAYYYKQEEWDELTEESYLDKEIHLRFIPETFHEAILSKKLFKKRKLHKRYNEWCEEVINRYYDKRNAQYNEQLLEKFEPAAKKLFSESFHDAKIINYEEINGDVTLLLDMSGGFTVEAVIELKFHNAKTEGTLAPYYIYDELIEMKEGFALRVLSSVGWPYEQWTIYFDSVQAKYVYHPSIAIEPGEITTIEQFIDQLHEDDYFIIKNKKITSIEPSQIQQKENGIFAEDVLLGEHFEDAIRKIYCATYKDPYAHFSEPIETEELQDAVFGDDPERRVRAFNTIFALGEEVASIVNNILRLAPYDEDEMYFNIMAGHFDQLNCLDKDVKEKWQ